MCQGVTSQLVFPSFFQLRMLLAPAEVDLNFVSNYRLGRPIKMLNAPEYVPTLMQLIFCLLACHTNLTVFCKGCISEIVFQIHAKLLTIVLSRRRFSHYKLQDRSSCCKKMHQERNQKPKGKAAWLKSGCLQHAKM